MFRPWLNRGLYFWSKLKKFEYLYFVNSKPFMIYPKTLLTALVVICSSVSYAQSTKAEKAAALKFAIRNSVNSIEYTFVTSQGGQTYYMQVTRDSLTSVLPFAGNSISGNAYVDQTANLNLRSLDFGYSVKTLKKNGQQVTMTPNDVDDINKIVLEIYEDGNATLIVNSVRRSRMIYHGYLYPGRAN